MPITDLSQLDLSKRYTYADYLTWQFQERVELLRGRIEKMIPAPGRKHQAISGELHFQIKGYLRERSCSVFAAPFDVRLPVPKAEQAYTVVQPDLCVVCNESMLDDRGCFGAPDLVIEILSPGNTKREMNDKFHIYEEAGVQEYWIVDPEHEAVLPYVRNAAGTFVGQAPKAAAGTLQSAVLEGFEVDLHLLFQSK